MKKTLAFLLLWALVFTSCSAKGADLPQKDVPGEETSGIVAQTSDSAVDAFLEIDPSDPSGAETSVEADSTTDEQTVTEDTTVEETTGENIETEENTDTTDAPEETTGEGTAPIETEVPDTTTEDTTTDESTGAETTEKEETAALEKNEKQYPDVPPGAKILYLTIDDGPGKFTETVLEILAEYNIPATFFLVGNFVNQYPDRVKAIADAGHTIGCHSMTHIYEDIYASPEAIAADVECWERAMENAVGYVPSERLYRFPGGTTCTRVNEEIFWDLFGALKDKDYRVYDWSCANNDAWYVNMREDQTKEEFFMESLQYSLTVCGNVRILLMHETVPETVGLLREMIEYLLAQGYVFMPLDHYEYDYIFAH